MAEYIKRPSFFEGQVVSAADLNGTVDHTRGALARHQRYQHLWGIAEGLALVPSDRQTAAGETYVDVAVNEGMAVDGTGRHIVVADQLQLSSDLFDQLNVAIADMDAWYPVFLQGRDRQEDSSQAIVGSCGMGGLSRVSEAFEISFGRQGDELDLEQQTVPEIDAGPSAGLTSTPWRILLGFVQWDASIKKFIAVDESYEGVRRRYVGVKADQVQAVGGRVVVRAEEETVQGGAALEITSEDDGALRFGPQNSSGDLTPVMTVDADGNLTVTGKIVGALAGGVQVESGLVSDGMLVPLPVGITQKQVDDGEVVLQIHVTPHLQAPARFDPAEKWMALPYECRVSGRRVLCRTRWFRTDGVVGSEDLPGVCDYVMMAFPADGGGS
ncbi:MAG: hypothetical protein GY906_13935 [bacterium]|nr:hypothetical protein [bacterium]